MRMLGLWLWLMFLGWAAVGGDRAPHGGGSPAPVAEGGTGVPPN